MGTVYFPPPVQLFCALLVAPPMAVDDVETVLAQRYGPIVLRSASLPFTQTTYYKGEMGAGLTRHYIAFAPLIRREELAHIKHTTNHLEAMWCNSSAQRRVNLDPGYLDLSKVVLASTKDHAHRLYIGTGIYAEITLQYRQKQFRPWEWTYPDYRLPETLAFFEHLRTHYRTHLRRAVVPPQ